MYVVKDLVPDMTNFYAQYKSIEPWLKKKLNLIKELNFTNQKKIVPNLMVFMNAFYALVPQLHVQAIFGFYKKF